VGALVKEMPRHVNAVQDGVRGADGIHALGRRIIKRATASAKRLVRSGVKFGRNPVAGINVAVYANWDVGTAIK
jgi:hypothetical protein